MLLRFKLALTQAHENHLKCHIVILIVIRIQFLLRINNIVSLSQGVPGEVGAVGAIGPRVCEIHYAKII